MPAASTRNAVRIAKGPRPAKNPPLPRIPLSRPDARSLRRPAHRRTSPILVEDTRPVALRRIVHISIETICLVAALPKAVDSDPRADSDMFDFQAEAHRQLPLAATADRSNECR